MTTLWRSKAFSALGAGFKADDTLHDGIHLKWMFDPRYGLPIQQDKQKTTDDGFYVYKLNKKIPCLKQIQLIQWVDSSNIPVFAEANNSPDGQLLIAADNKYYFLRKAEQESNRFVQKLRNQIRAIRKWKINKVETDFLDYLNDITKTLRSDLHKPAPSLEKAEVCAIDIRFSVGTGFNPVGDGSGNSGCLGILVSAFAKKTYAWVRAYDSNNQLVAQDWVGRHAFSGITSLSYLTRNKLTVQFRAPGIHHIVIEPVPSQPVLERDEFTWIFCEDYCNANIWELVNPNPINFKNSATAYSEDTLKNYYYRPFKKVFDWTSILNNWINGVINNPDLQSVLSIKNTFKMFQQKLTLDDNNPAPPPAEENKLSQSKIPILPAILQASVDPALASLLGLYSQLDPEIDKRDIKIEARMPFFDYENLQFLENFLKEISSKQIPAFWLDKFSGFANEINKASLRFAGLVICPVVATKPSLNDPAPIDTFVSSMDLPSNEFDETILLVDSLIQSPKPPFSLEPYKSVQCYELERSIEGQEFINPAASDATDPFKKMGLLPPVYIAKQNGSKLEIRDSFQLRLPPDESVQYRLRAYDVFARPGLWGDGAITAIPIPCKAPDPASNLSTQVVRRGNILWAQIFVSVDGIQKDLQARATQLEIALYDIDSTDNRAAEEIDWSGNKDARGLSLSYDTSIQYPDITSLTTQCVRLNWTGDSLNWAIDAANTCDTIYPITTPTVEVFENQVLNESTSNFRTFKFEIALADVTGLTPGTHAWCSRIRIKGICDNLAEKYSKESSNSFQYRLVAPPPPVIQPALSIIPESTYPDSQGDAYYNIDLANYLGAASNPKLINIYRIELEKLEENISTLVDKNILLAGAEAILLNLARANRSRYQKINDKPIAVSSSDHIYSVKIPGELETYHVLGIVGSNNQLEESSWDEAAIVLFKTPQPVDIPKINFVSLTNSKASSSISSKLTFRTEAGSVSSESSIAPKIQIIRYDLSAKQKRFIGESIGSWNEDQQFYQFSYQDLSMKSWRRYHYEATLLYSADKYSGAFVKSKQHAYADLLADGIITPFAGSPAPTITTIGSGFSVLFELAIGDFSFSISKTNAAKNKIRWSGNLLNGEVTDSEDISLKINKTTGRYQLTLNDTNSAAGDYTLRLFRDQQIPWIKKLETL